MNLCPADLVPLWKMKGSTVTFCHPVWAGDFLHFVYYQYEFLFLVRGCLIPLFNVVLEF